MSIAVETIIKTLVGAVIGAVLIKVKDYLSRGKAVNNAVRALAHDSFYRDCRELMMQETITEGELENLNFLHDAYTALGMNGTGEELYRRCLEKEIS